MLSAKRRFFLPEFSNCIVNSSSVARMRAEGRTLTDEEEERERERTSSKEAKRENCQLESDARSGQNEIRRINEGTARRTVQPTYRWCRVVWPARFPLNKLARRRRRRHFRCPSERGRRTSKELTRLTESGRKETHFVISSC